MKSLKYILTIAVVGVLTQSMVAQRTLTGTVNGVEGNLKGVKIAIMDSKEKAITNQQGEFTIEAPNADVYLKFSLKGMKTTILADASTSEVKVTLLPADKKLYRLILKEESLQLCDIYINNYPEAKDIASVKQLREKYFFIQAYEIAAAKFSDTALQNYLKVYPEGKYAQKVKEAIEIAAWQKARYENTKQSYQDYLTRYPDGKAVKVAEKKITEHD